ncbi:MAG: class I SAM-dependent methyltransferase [Thiohalomonadales bacterium]
MDIQKVVAQLVDSIKDVEGYLSEREAALVALAAVVPTSPGQILEIGSFKGKSTILLSKGAQLSDKALVTAIDPLTAPSHTDPSLGKDLSSENDFFNNLKIHGVTDNVDFHQKYSYELKNKWTSPIRLLWIDGDHTYPGAKLDFDLFSPYLSDGAIIMMDDVLNKFSGPLRVFVENIVLSSNFGAMGICGSIGWAQYHSDPAKVAPYRDEKLRLYKQLSRLLPYYLLDDLGRSKNKNAFEKLRFQFNRARTPHGEILPEEWIEKVSAKNKMNYRVID